MAIYNATKDSGYYMPCQSLIILYFNGQTGTYGVGVQAAVITGYLS